MRAGPAIACGADACMSAGASFDRLRMRKIGDGISADAGMKILILSLSKDARRPCNPPATPTDAWRAPRATPLLPEACGLGRGAGHSVRPS
jgi:hypothetical protein